MCTGFELRDSGRCPSYITSVHECSKAAVLLSLKHTTASSVAVSRSPPGCLYDSHSGSLKVNTVWSSWKVCGVPAECLCKVTTTRTPSQQTSAPSSTLVPTMQLQPPSVGTLLKQCNAMMNTTFVEPNITEVDIHQIGTIKCIC